MYFGKDAGSISAFLNKLRKSALGPGFRSRILRIVASWASEKILNHEGH